MSTRFALSTRSKIAALLIPLALWLVSIAPGVRAQEAAPAAAGPAAEVGLARRVVEHRLKNGIELLLVERHQAPVVATSIAFRVGGVNELPGSTGLAHLYEHMAFKGTRTIGTKNFKAESKVLAEMDRVSGEWRAERAKGTRADPERLASFAKRFSELERQSGEYVVNNEVAEIYQRNGAVGFNASTGKDMTRYVVSLPANRLELWAAMESDRMANPVLREFYKEKDVVLEERRLRYEDSPMGRLYEAFIAAAFTAHPYRMPVIGWTADLEGLSRPQTEAFFRAHYGPGNAVITIVGDIDTPSTIRMVEKYFGKIPAQPPSPPVEIIEPPSMGERRIEVEFDAEPVLMIGYHKPAMDHVDDAVFDTINALLSDGRTSRFYRSLVKEKRMAQSVSANTGVPGARYPHLFTIQATPRSPHTAAELENAIDEEINRLKTEPVGSEELQKILNQIDAGLIRSLESNSGLASQLGYFQTVAGDWRYLLENRERVARVTPQDVMRVAREYFNKTNRVVATLVRTGSIESREGEP